MGYNHWVAPNVRYPARPPHERRERYETMKSIPVIFVVTGCSIALLLKIGGGQQEIEKYLPQGAQETELNIECVSAVISKSGNEADYLVTLKLYIDPKFYTYFAIDNNVPNIKLDGDGDRFDVQPFKCNSEPT